MLDRPEEYAKMAEAEGTLWWYRALHHLVLAALDKHSPGKRVSILDAGCGTGGLMLFLRDRGYANVRGLDLSESAVAFCRQRGLDVRQGDLARVGELSAAGDADAIVSNDTMCYFDEAGQAGVVGQFARILKPGGLLVMNLPALRAFGGIHDVSVGIRKRFSRKDTGRLLDHAQFELLEETYWPFFASPLIYAARLAQRIKMRRNPGFEVRSDVELPPAWVNRLLGGVTLAENRLLRRKPFGSSLFLAARRRAASA
jgi:SAM-dependent methyltransferase